MSTKLNQFLEKVINSNDAESRLEKISGLEASARVQELKTWASEFDIDLNDSDLLTAREEGELSLEDVEDVSGGKYNLFHVFESILDGIEGAVEGVHSIVRGFVQD